MKPSISFVVLFFRDAPTVAPVLDAAHEVLLEICESFEILAIDDGSGDDTPAAIANAARRLPYVVPMLGTENVGVGASFQRAVKLARYPWIGYTDGDDQYDMADLRQFVRHLHSHDVISGLRDPRGDGWSRALASRCFNTLTRSFFSLAVKDINSALKLYRGDLLRKLSAWDAGAFYDAEILIRLRQDHGARIKELPIRHRPRSRGSATGLSRRNIANVLSNLTSVRMAPYRRNAWWEPVATGFVSGLRQLIRS